MFKRSPGQSRRRTDRRCLVSSGAKTFSDDLASVYNKGKCRRAKSGNSRYIFGCRDGTRVQDALEPARGRRQMRKRRGPSLGEPFGDHGGAGVGLVTKRTLSESSFTENGMNSNIEGSRD